VTPLPSITSGSSSRTGALVTPPGRDAVRQHARDEVHDDLVE
jgi:hypothetical protein